MFSDNFYPTPPDVIDQMLAPLSEVNPHLRQHGRFFKTHYTQVLEPSAGKGDIVDRLVTHYNVRKSRIYCIESNFELQTLLTGKEYRVIDSDFLAFCDPYYFDLIVMNPPFEQGVDHLLKAWEILKAGDIVCLLNAETLRNTYTEKRRLLAHIIQQHGRMESIGAAFADAERKTNVECVIVWLHKDASKDAAGENFDPHQIDWDTAESEADFQPSELASADIIQALVAQYNEAVRCLVEKHRLEARYRFYTRGIQVSFRDESPKEKEARIEREEREAEITINDKILELKKGFWNYVFHKTNLGRITTSNYRETFMKRVETLSQLAFSVNNIMAVIEGFMYDMENIVTDCIVESFDKATAYHEKNRVYTEGWKTNKSWKINKTIIMPNGVKHEGYFGWSFNYYNRDFFTDLDKAMCFLSGKRIDDVTTIAQAFEAAKEAKQVASGVKLDSAFFTIKVYKKGTVHLTFKDLDLLARFNLVAAQNKKWVDGGY